MTPLSFWFAGDLPSDWHWRESSVDPAGLGCRQCVPLVAFAVLVVAAVTTQRTCGARRRGQQTMVAESSRAPLARI